jgi:CheY-like chemotaxis protein
MIRPRILLVGGRPLVAEMLSENLRHDDRYELEWVQYCDDALALLQGQQIDLVLVLSLHVLWRRWPRGHSPARHVDLANAFLFLMQLHAFHNPPPVILISASPRAEAENEALAHDAFAFIPNRLTWPSLTGSWYLRLRAEEACRRSNTLQAGDRP